MTYSCTEIFPLPFLSALSNSSSIALVCRRSLRLLPTMKAAMIKSTSDGTTGARLRGLRRVGGGHPHEKVPLQLVRSKIELARYFSTYARRSEKFQDNKNLENLPLEMNRIWKAAARKFFFGSSIRIICLSKCF